MGQALALKTGPVNPPKLPMPLLQSYCGMDITAHPVP